MASKILSFMLTSFVLFSSVLSWTPAFVHAQAVSPSGSCYTFTRNLGEGRPLSSQEALALTQDLSNAGLWNATSPITSYDDNVASAISGFQEKYAAQILTPNGLSYGTGFLGVSTRSVLNELYGCPTSQSSPSVQCPVGYSCTPITQTIQGCPPGYACSPAVVPGQTGNSTPNSYQNQGTSATVSVSLDPNTARTETLPVTDPASGTYLGLPLLTFDLNTQTSGLHLHSLTVHLAENGPGLLTNAYLYQGTALVDSVQISPNATDIATFTIPDGTMAANIASNANVPFTVAVDVTGLKNFAGDTSVPVTLAATVSAADVAVYNSADSSVGISGAANGSPVTVESLGVRFSLPNMPTITNQISVATSSAGNHIGTYTATFNVQATAVHTNATIGLPNSANPAVLPTYSFVSIFRNSANINGPQEQLSNYNPIVSYSQPSSTTLSSDGTSFTFGPDQTITIPVTVSFSVSNPNANTYSVALRAMQWTLGGLVEYSSLFPLNANSTLMTSSI